MDRGLFFWILWLLAVFGFGFLTWPNYRGVGAGLIVFILLAVLGWSVYGPILR